jgi:molecular chaperone GrpE
MSKRHEKKHVKSSVDIAMEKAHSMASGEEHKQVGKEVTIPDSELHELREKASKADEYHDRMLRAVAELENYKRRVERERVELLKYGQAELMAELLTVLDNFERALSAAESTRDVKNIVSGVKLIQKQLLSVLEKSGLEPIEAVGKQFNPELHEALGEVETEDHPDGTVVSEQLKGYLLNKRLLRPAAVTVSRNKRKAGERERLEEEAAAGRENEGGQDGEESPPLL